MFEWKFVRGENVFAQFVRTFYFILCILHHTHYPLEVKYYTLDVDSGLQPLCITYSTTLMCCMMHMTSLRVHTWVNHDAHFCAENTTCSEKGGLKSELFDLDFWVPHECHTAMCHTGKHSQFSSWHSSSFSSCFHLSAPSRQNPTVALTPSMSNGLSGCSTVT